MTKRVKDFRPASRNANKHTARGMGALQKSIESDGWIGAMTTAADGEMIAGSARIETVAQVFGTDAEPIIVESDGTRPVLVVRTDIPKADDPRAQRLALADNRVHEIDMSWDVEVLAGFDADVLGELWTAEELSDLGQQWADEQRGKQEDAGAQVDKAEELRVKWGVESGQLWQLGEHRLVCGDCTDKATVATVMGGEKAQLVVTSPPYAVGKEYEADVSFAEHITLLENVADRCIENVVPGGFIFTNFDEIAPLSHASPLTGSKRQCIYLISKDYWRIFHEERRCDLYAQRIWYKPFNRLQQPFWSYHTSIPHHQEWEHIWTWRTPGGEGDRVCDWDISVYAVWDTRKEATDDKPLTRHVAAFPVGIPERAIKAHSLHGEIVLEPFSGSGTTLIACERLGRKCRAVEISPAYCAVAIERWAQTTGKVPILANGTA